MALTSRAAHLGNKGVNVAFHSLPSPWASCAGLYILPLISSHHGFAKRVDIRLKNYRKCATWRM